MTDAFERLATVADRRNVGRLSALDHHHLDPELSRRRYLAKGGRAAAVLGNDGVDPVAFEQFRFIPLGKRAGGENGGSIGQVERRRYRVDAAYDVAVLRRFLEMEGLLPADREEDTARRLSKGGDRLGDTVDASPAITGAGLPGGAAEREDWRTRYSSRSGGVLRDPRSEGVRRVYEEGDALVQQECGESLRPPRSRLCVSEAAAGGVRPCGRQGRPQRRSADRRQGAPRAAAPRSFRRGSECEACPWLTCRTTVPPSSLPGSS